VLAPRNVPATAAQRSGKRKDRLESWSRGINGKSKELSVFSVRIKGRAVERTNLVSQLKHVDAAPLFVKRAQSNPTWYVSPLKWIGGNGGT
jgi:hypothetical protein